MKSISKIIIRSYRPIDYISVKQVLKESEIFDSKSDTEYGLRHKVNLNPGSILVAVVDDSVVGNIFVVEDGWAAFLFRLAVKKGYRNMGVGSKLLSSAERLIRRKGVREVALFVENDKSSLKDYYLKRGYYMGGVSRCMRKHLN